jgi:3-deoxy-D-manno-octulosonic-acid transferase
MLKAIYDAIWYPVLPFALLATARRDPNSRQQRLGRLDSAFGIVHGAPRIWFHAASVGEIEGVRAVAQALLREYPGCTAFITSMTPAGRDAAGVRIPEARAHLLAPFDCPLCVRAFLRVVKPKLVVIAETELWPNFFLEAKRIGARIAILNGRISERSMKRYRIVRSVFAKILEATDVIMTQTSDDAGRFATLGAPRERIVVTGNTKFDAADVEPPLRTELEVYAARKRLFVAGSTAPGEEEIVIEAYQALRIRFPDLNLVVAPRHPDRVDDIELILRRRGLDYLKASMLNSPPHPAPVLLLDTMGELRGLYRCAQVAFVGGSLVEGRGGQSLAEPASAGVPVLFGPFHSSQREIAAELVAGGGGEVVESARDVVEKAAALLSDDDLRRRRGQSAKSTLEKLSGAVEASLGQLRTLINLK